MIHSFSQTDEYGCIFPVCPLLQQQDDARNAAQIRSVWSRLTLESTSALCDAGSLGQSFAKSYVFIGVASNGFRRRRHARSSLATEKVARLLGYDRNPRRERDLRILRTAMQLKIANTKPTSVVKAKSKLAEETHSDRSVQYILETRIIASKYGCAVFDVPKYLDRWIPEEPTLQRKNLARRMRRTWPTRAQWDKANAKFERLWRMRTLTEAAYELAKDNKPITGESLAPLLFLNHDREWAWKVNEKKREFHKLPGESVILDPYGKRGISLRLFRQRYERKDIEDAKNVTEGMMQSEQIDRSR